jgi:hypothetical protein
MTAKKKVTRKKEVDLAKEEQFRHIQIAQRAVAASNFLPVHGFLTGRQAMALATKVKKYIIKHKLMLVDKSWKEYVVLPGGTKLRAKWQLICG